jgi:uncharacterized membrane protein
MSARSIQTVSLLIATVMTGLMAGVFGLYSHTIMRGLRKVDDRTFVGAFQAIDRAIINPLFMSTFFGAMAFSGLTCVMTFREGGRTLLPWVATATALYVVVVIITVAVHVPLNDGIKAAGQVDSITDLARVRADFHETRWVAWNLVRAMASTIALVCLAWALVLDGRSNDRSTTVAAPIVSTRQPSQTFDAPPQR